MKGKTMKPGVYLRLFIPVDGLDPEQVARAVATASRIETKVAAMLAQGADPDRLMDKLESYFPGG